MKTPTGIGPVGNRQRAMRAEADLVRKPATARIAAARLHEKACVPQGSRLCICGVARFIEGDDARVHRRDQPGGTWCVGVRCLLDGTHSLWLRPLIGAKPNHGFFGCQHLVAKICAAPPPAWREASSMDATTMRRTARDNTHAAVQVFIGKCFFCGVSRAAPCECAPTFRAHAASRRGCAAALNGACSTEKKILRPARFSRRTKANCAQLRRRSRCAHVAATARAAQEKTDWRRPDPVARREAGTLRGAAATRTAPRKRNRPHSGGRWFARCRRDVSGRRPRAVRRSRRGRAVR